MTRQRVATLALVSMLAASVTTTAEAKLEASIALQPSEPTVGQPVRITMRTDVVLARSERVRLFAVGPWTAHAGQGVLDVGLVRTGPRVFTTRLRFTYAGRWSLQVASTSGATLAARHVRVRSSAATSSVRK